MTRAKDISKIVTDANLSGTLDVAGIVTGSGVVRSGNDTSSMQIQKSGVNGFINMNDTGGIIYRLGSSFTERMRINSSGNVGIGTSSPNNNLHILGSSGLRIVNSDDTSNLSILGFDNNESPSLNLYSNNSVTARVHSEGDSYFNGGNVGIGTSSPNNQLEIKSTTNDNGIRLSNTVGSYYHLVRSNGDGLLFDADAGNTGGSGADIRFQVKGTERMRINSSGNVGIGTNSPATYSGYNVVDVRGSTNGGFIQVGNGTVKNSFYQSSSVGFFGTQSNHSAGIVTNGSERMRITSSGTLLVGKTNTTANVNGIELEASGTIVSTRDNNTNIFLNRRTSDGNLIEFRKDNSTVGNIGVSGANLNIGNGDAGLQFNGGADTIRPWNITSNAARDNAIDLGDPFDRFDDIYATNGTIQTSDRNEKQDIEELSEAEQRVAVVAKGLMRKFRWKDKVAEKGDNARTHFGIIAQDLQDAFTAEGLDAGDYAMFCSNTWWEKEISVDAVEADEQNGIEAKDAYTYMDTKDEATEGYTEKTRLGVRYNQLLAFIISAI